MILTTYSSRCFKSSLIQNDKLRSMLIVGIAVASSICGFSNNVIAQDEMKSPSQLDGSRLEGGKPPSAGEQQVQAKRGQAAQLLFRELDNLIPGDFQKGSAEEKEVTAVVEAFQGNDAKGVVAMVEALAKKPGYPPSDVMLAAMSYSTNDQKTGALLLERAAVKSPDHPAVYSAFARLAANSGRTTDARLHFEKLSSIVETAQLPTSEKEFYRAQYLDGLIDIAIKQQRLAEARKLLTQQRDKLPNHPKVLMVSAELEFKENKIDACVAYLKTMKSKYPKSRAPEAIVASWYQRIGNDAASEKWIRTAAEQYPQDAQVQLEFASWALNVEDFPTASTAVKQAEGILLETPFSKNLKAKIAFARESYGVAEAHYESLMSSQPMDSDLSNMYALCLVESKKQDKMSKALAIASRNLQAMPNNRVAIAALGYIHLQSGNLENAKLAFSKASQLGGNSPEIDYFIACYLHQSGDAPKAQQFIERALGQKGLFLYRSSALKLLEEIKAAELPTPDK